MRATVLFFSSWNNPLVIAVCCNRVAYFHHRRRARHCALAARRQSPYPRPKLLGTTWGHGIVKATFVREKVVKWKVTCSGLYSLYIICAHHLAISCCPVVCLMYFFNLVFFLIFCSH